MKFFDKDDFLLNVAIFLPLSYLLVKYGIRLYKKREQILNPKPLNSGQK